MKTERLNYIDALRGFTFISMALYHLMWDLVFIYGVSVGTSLVAQMVKHLPTMRETWVPSLGQEDALEKEMATHSSTLAFVH